MKAGKRWMWMPAALLLAGGTVVAQQGSQGAEAQQQAEGCQCPMMGQGHGKKGHGGACPMSKARVSVENTKDGAVVRMTAKDPADVGKVQEMAKHMSQCPCMSGSSAQPTPEAPK